MNDSSSREKVVDANVLIHGRGQVQGKVLFTPGVKKELKSRKAAFNLEKMDYSVYEPSEESQEEVRRKSREINSPTSKEDEQALALSLGKKAELVTDDKALQNLAKHLGVDYTGFNSDEIEKKLEWKKVCENCGREIEDVACENCGSEKLERKRR